MKLLPCSSRYLSRRQSPTSQAESFATSHVQVDLPPAAILRRETRHEPNCFVMAPRSSKPTRGEYREVPGEHWSLQELGDFGPPFNSRSKDFAIAWSKRRFSNREHFPFCCASSARPIAVLLPETRLIRTRRTDPNATRSNMKEHERQVRLNNAFAALRVLLPTENAEARLSKVKVLRLAVEYTRKLQQLLEDTKPQATSTPVKQPFVASDCFDTTSLCFSPATLNNTRLLLQTHSRATDYSIAYVSEADSGNCSYNDSFEKERRPYDYFARYDWLSYRAY